MSDHVVVCVDRAVTSGAVQESGDVIVVSKDEGVSCSVTARDVSGKRVEENEAFSDGDEDEPLIQMVECRICQEEDRIKNLENPCACSGSLKYAHRKCVQRWCDEKGDIICEICHQHYQPGYTAPPRPPATEEVAIDIGGWTISGTPYDIRDPRLLVMADAERRLVEAEYDEYNASNASGVAFCRSAIMILMALLLLRHAMSITDGDEEEEDDMIAFFSLFLLRVAGFLLPCYIMAWGISMLQRRRERQEAAALAATQVAFVVQAGQRGGLHFALAPAPTPTPAQAQAVTPHHEPAPHYQPGYTAPPRPPATEEVAIDIGGWTISGTPYDIRDPRLLVMADAERRLVEAEYDEYNASNASGVAFCRSAIMILMALLLLRHAMSITDGDEEEEDDMIAFFSLFLLRVAGFLLPCYIMAWGISMLQRRRERQEAAALAATQVAFVVQAGQRGGLHFALAPAPTPTPAQAQAVTPHHEPAPVSPQQEIV